MTNFNQLFDQQIESLIQEYSVDYVILALKQISDQQLLFISFDDFKLLDDPILKLYIQVVEEIEAVMFHPEYGLSKSNDLNELIERTLAKIRG